MESKQQFTNRIMGDLHDTVALQKKEFKDLTKDEVTFMMVKFMQCVEDLDDNLSEHEGKGSMPVTQHYMRKNGWTFDKDSPLYSCLHSMVYSTLYPKD